MRAQLERERPRTLRTACTCISRSARRWRMPATTPNRSSTIAQGNALRRAQIRYDAAATCTSTSGARRRSSHRSFFAAAPARAAPARDPIFIVGLPRSGSTLIEQILSSHSQVEGTMELPDIPTLAQSVGGRSRRATPTLSGGARPRCAPDSCARWASSTSSARASSARPAAPFFIDKMPNNFVHVGLIHLILPNAKIIDARRHPLGCCFSGFKQHFARGQDFTYDLADIGRYYRDYVELMAHFDAVLPGRVHRVIYEQHGRRHRGRGAARCSTTAACRSSRLPALLRERARRAHRQLRAGAPADLPRGPASSGGTTSPGSGR